MLFTSKVNKVKIRLSEDNLASRKGTGGIMEKEMDEIRARIEGLPKGTISVKRINGREYEYWQFYENGRQVTKRVKGEELETLRVQIAERKRLEKLLKEKGNKPTNSEMSSKSDGRQGLDHSGDEQQHLADDTWHSLVRLGDGLHRFVEPVRSFRKREIYQNLHNYIYGPEDDRVFILYGLRRTGKTTLIRQLILNMSPDDQGRTAFLQALPDETLADLNQDLKHLERKGYRYIFIDEVTLLSDFIDGAALLSDIFAASGMKIVLSGTDSLGFLFAEDEQLYDRCWLLHTTFIPYREFERVLGIQGVDQYIRYGGTMSMGGINYNFGATFSSAKMTNEYIDTAIAGNIQHSLKYYQHEGHFRELYDLYEKNELTSAINRVIEDMNHRFTLEVLERTFESHDLGVSRTNLRKDRDNPTDALDTVDTRAVTERLRKMLEIREREERTVPLTDEHVREIREYLEMLDLIRYVDIVISGSEENARKRTIFTQPGLRYAQAEALITSLMQDAVFRDLGIKERMRITERILNEIRGRMMEDIILLETSMAHPKWQVFVLQFAVGEFDMVTFDPESITCRLYEIKHSSLALPGQYRHLADEAKLRETRYQYGDIEGRYIIYNGSGCTQDGIQYINVEEYLRGLGADNGAAPATSLQV